MFGLYFGSALLGMCREVGDIRLFFAFLFMAQTCKSDLISVLHSRSKTKSTRNQH